MNRILLVAEDPDSLYKRAAQLFLETVTAAVQERDRCSVAFCGGTTPIKLFELLAGPYFKQRIPWAEVHVFWGDERFVPPTSADSNFKLVNDHLLSKIPIPPGNIHRIPAEMESARDAAKAYEQTLKVFFRLDGAWPKLDFNLLGIGEDGHTASLFPGTTAINEKEHWVTANFVEKLSSDRITLTLPVLNNARRTVILCAGEKKAIILREVFREDMAGDRYPIQLVHPSGELIWLVDKSATLKLPSALANEAVHFS